jgi:hypothetical protein
MGAQASLPASVRQHALLFALAAPMARRDACAPSSRAIATDYRELIECLRINLKQQANRAIHEAPVGHEYLW